ncbi:hypothetical protein KIPB_005628, partial [Kipferlia bialata]
YPSEYVDGERELIKETHKMYLIMMRGNKDTGRINFQALLTEPWDSLDINTRNAFEHHTWTDYDSDEAWRIDQEITRQEEEAKIAKAKEKASLELAGKASATEGGAEGEEEVQVKEEHIEETDLQRRVRLKRESANRKKERQKNKEKRMAEEAARKAEAEQAQREAERAEIRLKRGFAAPTSAVPQSSLSLGSLAPITLVRQDAGKAVKGEAAPLLSKVRTEPLVVPDPDSVYDYTCCNKGCCKAFAADPEWRQSFAREKYRAAHGPQGTIGHRKSLMVVTFFFDPSTRTGLSVCYKCIQHLLGVQSSMVKTAIDGERARLEELEELEGVEVEEERERDEVQEAQEAEAEDEESSSSSLAFSESSSDDAATGVSKDRGHLTTGTVQTQYRPMTGPVTGGVPEDDPFDALDLGEELAQGDDDGDDANLDGDDANLDGDDGDIFMKSSSDREGEGEGEGEAVSLKVDIGTPPEAAACGDVKMDGEGERVTGDVQMKETGDVSMERERERGPEASVPVCEEYSERQERMKYLKGYPEDRVEELLSALSANPTLCQGGRGRAAAGLGEQKRRFIAKWFYSPDGKLIINSIHAAKVMRVAPATVVDAAKYIDQPHSLSPIALPTPAAQAKTATPRLVYGEGSEQATLITSLLDGLSDSKRHSHLLSTSKWVCGCAEECLQGVVPETRIALAVDYAASVQSRAIGAITPNRHQFILRWGLADPTTCDICEGALSRILKCRKNRVQTLLTGAREAVYLPEAPAVSSAPDAPDASAPLPTIHLPSDTAATIAAAVSPALSLSSASVPTKVLELKPLKGLEGVEAEKGVEGVEGVTEENTATTVPATTGSIPRPSLLVPPVPSDDSTTIGVSGDVTMGGDNTAAEAEQAESETDALSLTISPAESEAETTVPEGEGSDAYIPQAEAEGEGEGEGGSLPTTPVTMAERESARPRRSSRVKRESTPAVDEVDAPPEEGIEDVFAPCCGKKNCVEHISQEVKTQVMSMRQSIKALEGMETGTKGEMAERKRGISQKRREIVHVLYTAFPTCCYGLSKRASGVKSSKYLTVWKKEVTENKTL